MNTLLLLQTAPSPAGTSASSAVITSAFIAASVSLVATLIAHMRETGRDSKRAKLADTAMKHVAFVREWFSAAERFELEELETHRESARQQLRTIREHYETQLAILDRPPIERFRGVLLAVIAIASFGGVVYMATKLGTGGASSAPTTAEPFLHGLDSVGRWLLIHLGPTTFGMTAVGILMALIAWHVFHRRQLTRDRTFRILAGILEVWLGVYLWILLSLTSPPAFELAPRELLPYAGLLVLVVTFSSGVQSIRSTFRRGPV